MKAFKLFSMAAVALVMAACSTDEIEQTPQQPAKAGGVIEFTGTICAGGTTRTVITEGTGDDADKLLVAWNLYDELHLFQGKTEYGTALVTYVNEETGVATIQGELAKSGYNLNNAFTIKYFGNATSEEYLKTFLQNQTGTKARIADYDWREGEGKLVLNTGTNKYELNNKVTMASKIAIWKLTLKDNNNDQLKMNQRVEQLQIISDGDVIAGSGDEFAGGSTNEVWLAVPAISEAGISILYSNSGGHYIFSKSNVSLAASTFYESTVNMGEPLEQCLRLTSTSGEIHLGPGETLIGTGGPDTHVYIDEAASVTLQDVNITSIDESHTWAGITCDGNATITLKGTNKLAGEGGPAILAAHNEQSGEPEFTLTINGPGKLEATGSAGSAGIGGDNDDICGNIIINGGEITATSSENILTGGAGIGCGYNGTCGNITINGGTIKATSGYGGAGIGCALGISSNNSTCGDITINGGEITANGNKASAAGIGCSEYSKCGKITITGGTVNTSGGTSGGPGIGSKNLATCGDITISGGTVNAKGKVNSAGIGTASKVVATNKDDCGNISISGGNVTATGGGYGAGIGTGSDGLCGTISISGGTVIATGGGNAPGIGCGTKRIDVSTCGAITISGGTVTVTGNTYYEDQPKPAIGFEAESGNVCPSVTIKTSIMSLEMTNASAPDKKVSNFVNATQVFANSTEITSGLSQNVDGMAIATGMSMAGFSTSYNTTTKTWTVSKTE